MYQPVAVFLILVNGQPAQEVEQAPPPRDVVEELVRTINDNPNPLHREMTPSVNKLMVRGDMAIPPMLDLMLSSDRDTRLRAVTVLRGIVLLQHGYKPGQGWKDDASEERFHLMWKSLGNLTSDASREDREKAVKLWREWLVKKDRM